jgi:hypothetical protein
VAPTLFSIDAELATFLTSGVSVVVATRSAALQPHATRACGIRVAAPDRVSVLLPYASSAQAIANLRDNGEIAVCASSPRDYRTVQLKGRQVEARASTTEDLLISQEQLRAFAAVCAELGISRQKIRNVWLFDSLCVEIQVTSVYRQTPGPGAGAAIERECNEH